MSTSEFTAQIADTAFGNINVAEVTPSVRDVSLLERTRTISEGGGDSGVFNEVTRPTANEAMQIVDQALPLVLDELSEDLPSYLYPRIKQAVALQAAILIETSFFREQANQNAVAAYTAMLMQIMGFLRARGGDATGGRAVDSVVIRSSMTDYDEYYPVPPPKEVIEWLKSASS